MVTSRASEPLLERIPLGASEPFRTRVLTKRSEPPALSEPVNMCEPNRVSATTARSELLGKSVPSGRSEPTLSSVPKEVREPGGDESYESLERDVCVECTELADRAGI